MYQLTGKNIKYQNITLFIVFLIKWLQTCSTQESSFKSLLFKYYWPRLLNGSVYMLLYIILEKYSQGSSFASLDGDVKEDDCISFFFVTLLSWQRLA